MEFGLPLPVLITAARLSIVTVVSVDFQSPMDRVV